MKQSNKVCQHVNVLNTKCTQQLLNFKNESAAVHLETINYTYNIGSVHS